MLKLRVQVDVAHSMLRTMSILVTCLPQDASPGNNNNNNVTILSNNLQRLKVQVWDRGPTEEDLIVS